MNDEIRNALLETWVKQWTLAEKLKISEFTLCCWLRHELPDDKKRTALEAIKELAGAISGGAGDGKEKC